MKNCIRCNQPFKPTYHTTKLCSEECRKAQKAANSRKYRLNNPEAALQKEARLRKKYKENGRAAEYRRQRRASKAGYLDRFMERIREITPDTDITREWLDHIFEPECAVTGVAFQYSREGQTSFLNPYAPSIDRIDSSLGYYARNVQITLAAVNFAKNQFSMEDFTDVWRDIASSWKALTETKTNDRTESDNA